LAPDLKHHQQQTHSFPEREVLGRNLAEDPEMILQNPGIGAVSPENPEIGAAIPENPRTEAATPETSETGA